MAEQAGYYRSLEQLANTPEFRAFAAAEFPGFANVYESLGEAEPRDSDPESAGLNRRKFLALSAATLQSSRVWPGVGARTSRFSLHAVLPDNRQPTHIGVPGKPSARRKLTYRPAAAADQQIRKVTTADPRRSKATRSTRAASAAPTPTRKRSFSTCTAPIAVFSDKYPSVMEGHLAAEVEDFGCNCTCGKPKSSPRTRARAIILTEQVASPAVRTRGR